MPLSPVVDSLSIALSRGEIARVKAWLEQFAGRHQLGPNWLHRISLCSEELLTNVLMHGIGCSARSDVLVTVALGERETTLTLEDGCAPFDPTCVPPPSRPESLEAAPVGGLGLHLVRQFSSGMEYRRVGDVNRLTIHFL